jgi:hypothetical protein
MDTSLGSLESRLSRAEKRLRIFQVTSVAAIVVCAGFAVHAGLQLRNRNSGGIVRVKGLIIEDSSGHDRILLGAPVPVESGRKRHDETVGMVILGDAGVDRVVLGAPVPEPQINGQAGTRVGRSTGFILNDENGDERGGMGVLDNDGRVTLGLDYPHGSAEAISLAVLPDETSLQIHDSKTMVRAALVERKDSPPILFGLNLAKPSKIDMGVLRLSPYMSKHVITDASDAALNKALDDAGRLTP